MAQDWTAATIRGGHDQARPRSTQPLTYSGSLEKYQSQDVTPAIGREFIGLQVVDLLQAPDSYRLIRDLAITISQRGVVFLRGQAVTPQQMRQFCERLTELAGCPESSKLHVHPMTEEGSELGDQISVISSDKQKKGGGLTHQLDDTSRFASAGWHSDITFEPVPSDYAMLKIHTLPATGGDTMWASGYDLYDKLSPSMAAYLETLTAVHDATFFHEEARRLGNPLREGIRGSPLNQGPALRAVHPIIRTNPVTGWKSVYVNRGFTKRIVEVSKDESDMLLGYLFNLVTQNHDVQVRLKWSKNDLAVWDNRSTWHCATYDYAGARAGDRVCSLGEAPYLDIKSRSRRQALEEELEAKSNSQHADQQQQEQVVPVSDQSPSGIAPKADIVHSLPDQTASAIASAQTANNDKRDVVDESLQTRGEPRQASEVTPEASVVESNVAAASSAKVESLEVAHQTLSSADTDAGTVKISPARADSVHDEDIAQLA